MNDANEIVNNEIHRLDHQADAAFETVNVQFQAVLDGVEKTRQEVLADVRRKKDEKKKILEEQLNIIQSEKNKVDADVKVTADLFVYHLFILAMGIIVVGHTSPK